jgi:uncharacterized protein (DUF58 family)
MVLSERGPAWKKLRAGLGRLCQPWVMQRYTYPDRVVTVELRQRLPVAAFLALLVWYLMAPTDVVVMSLAALGGLLLCGYLWARAMAQQVVAQRALHYTALQVGDEIEEIIALSNASVFPVAWAEFSDHSNLPGYTVSSVRMADPQSALTWRAHTLCTRRGTFTLGPWELRLGDPFNFFGVQQIYTQRQEILIYPPLAPLPLHLLPNAAAMGTHRPLHQPLPAETIDVISVRPYVPGDPMRHLHWRTTARRQAPYTKVFEPEASSTVWLMPDFDPAAHSGEGSDTTEELMVLLTASLAAQLLKMHLSVGLLTCVDSLRVVAPRAGSMHLWSLLRALAPLHPVAAGATLTQTLTQARPLISIGDLVVVITPAVTGDWPAALRQLTHRGSAAEALLIDRAAFGGEGQVEAARTALMGLGITARIVRRGELQPVSSLYGALRRWEFMTLGTGRVVVRQKPREMVTPPSGP